MEYSNLAKEKRSLALKAMNNERTRVIDHNEPVTKKQQQLSEKRSKQNKAAKRRSAAKASKRYNATHWRGWRESDGKQYPVTVIKKSEMQKEDGI